MKKHIRKIKLWVRWDLPHLHTDFIRGLKNLLKWFPIIWRDRDFDDSFIFEILKFKIQKTAIYIGTNDRHTTAKRDSEIMLMCVRLIERVQKEYYAAEYIDYMESEFEWLDIEGSNSKELKTNTTKENFSDYFKKYPLVYRKAKEASTSKNWLYTEVNDQTLAMWICHYNHNRARRILFTLLERNIESWWD